MAFSSLTFGPTVLPSLPQHCSFDRNNRQYHLWDYSQSLPGLSWGWETLLVPEQSKFHGTDDQYFGCMIKCPEGPLAALLSCVLWHPLDMWLDNTMSLFSPRQAFSIAFHLSLLPVEWFCCCQTALWILDLEWVVTFCNWKFITQRQFHWALSLFNTQSLTTQDHMDF